MNNSLVQRGYNISKATAEEFGEKSILLHKEDHRSTLEFRKLCGKHEEKVGIPFLKEAENRMFNKDKCATSN